MSRAAIATVMFALATWPLTGSAVTTEAGPALQRFLARANEPLTQYRAFRHLEAQNGRFKKEATLDVMTELSPSGGFTYQVLQSTGSDYILGKVLRPMLEIEDRTVASGDPSRFALTPENYELRLADQDEPGLVKLLAKPRRQDANLIEGAVFVTSSDSDLVRVEGRLVKNPSFWTSRVDVVRHYARVSGIRVPVRLETKAHVKFAGVSTLSMTYDYEMVNGRPVLDDEAP